MYSQQYEQQRQRSHRTRHPADYQTSRQHACQRDDRLLAGILRVQLAEVIRAGEVRTQAGLRATGSDAAESAQDARGGEEDSAPRAGGDGRAQDIKDEGSVVQHIGQQPVPLAFGTQGGANAVSEKDRGDPADRVLRDGEEQRGRR